MLKCLLIMSYLQNEDAYKTVSVFGLLTIGDTCNLNFMIPMEMVYTPLPLKLFLEDMEYKFFLDSTKELKKLWKQELQCTKSPTDIYTNRLANITKDNTVFEMWFASTPVPVRESVNSILIINQTSNMLGFFLYLKYLIFIQLTLIKPTMKNKKTLFLVILLITVVFNFFQFGVLIPSIQAYVYLDLETGDTYLNDFPAKGIQVESRFDLKLAWNNNVIIWVLTGMQPTRLPLF